MNLSLESGVQKLIDERVNSGKYSAPEAVDDHGHSWRSISNGLPSDFGFPIVVHPHDPDTVYVVPLEGMTRTCPGGAPAVWRSENDGDSWNRLARWMPKKESFFTVLRDAMDAVV